MRGCTSKKRDVADDAVPKEASIGGTASLSVVLPVLIAKLLDSGIEMTRNDTGWRFTSLRGRFSSFSVTCSLAETGTRTDALISDATGALFPGSSLRLNFTSGSILVTYPLGHIRWVTRPGFQYYSLLSGGKRPCISQGDLVAFRLSEHGLIPHRDQLAALLPGDQGTIWCRARPPILGAGNRWRESGQIALGGNSRHQAIGRMKWVEPIPGDHRTMQVVALEILMIRHDPTDGIHPTARLESGSHTLISKLPGFSDPIKEMTPCAEVLP